MPPEGKTLLIVGQDLGAIGGLADYEDGYTDHINVIPAGLTTYTGLPALGGLKTLDNWGSGDVSAQMLMDEPTYANSVLSMGYGWEQMICETSAQVSKIKPLTS